MVPTRFAYHKTTTCCSQRVSFTPPKRHHLTCWSGSWTASKAERAVRHRFRCLGAVELKIFSRRDKSEVSGSGSGSDHLFLACDSCRNTLLRAKSESHFCINSVPADVQEGHLDKSLGRPSEKSKTSPRPTARLSGHHTQVCVVVTVDSENHFVSADDTCLVRGVGVGRGLGRGVSLFGVCCAFQDCCLCAHHISFIRHLKWVVHCVVVDRFFQDTGLQR